MIGINKLTGIRIGLPTPTIAEIRKIRENGPVFPTPDGGSVQVKGLSIVPNNWKSTIIATRLNLVITHPDNGGFCNLIIGRQQKETKLA